MQYEHIPELNQQPMVSFDFDDTLAISCTDQGDWTSLPNFEMLDLLRQYATDGCRVAVISSREEGDKGEIVEFVQRYKLPVAKIICTDGDFKGPILAALGVVVHHDDLERSDEDPTSAYTGKWCKVR